MSNVGQPLLSGLQLADNEWLRVHEIMQLTLPKAPYIVLSACETAGIGRAAPDEVVGLPAAFLQAGASGVVASTWPVTDDSSPLLMAKLYDELQGASDNFSMGLSRAQAWLRDASPKLLEDTARQYGIPDLKIPQRSTPFAHPFFWAAFSYMG
jgi:CHAT domain-containing protein